MICRNCKHYQVGNLCAHPDLVDRITGEPGDCRELRDQREDPSAPERPYCGWEGKLWEAK